MSTKRDLERLEQLGDDAFSFIGQSVDRPAPEPEAPEPVRTKQISARLPMPLYRRLKDRLYDADETQEEMVIRLLTAELDRVGA